MSPLALGLTAWLFSSPLAGPLLAPPPSTAISDADAPALSKKQAYLATKGGKDGRARKVGRRAHMPVFARNLRTNEIAILEGPGKLRTEARHDFFRCWFTLKPSEIPANLVEVLVNAANEFETKEVRIISGFRHPKYNLLLRKKGREVAKRSRHTRSQAIDFFLPGVKVKPLYTWLLATHKGGVGFYAQSEFVHVDLGPKRTWNGT